MKSKMIYGSDKDDFIWKMETVYNPIEKLHYTLAKWHLGKLLKINQEAVDKMYDRVYNDIIKEMNYEPRALTNITVEQLIDKIDKINKVNEGYDVGCEDIKKGLENTANVLEKHYTLRDIEPICNAVVKLKGDDDESIN